MKTSSKCKSEMLGRMQWNVRKNAMRTSKGKSKMLGRMQWNHRANVNQKCLEESNENI